MTREPCELCGVTEAEFSARSGGSSFFVDCLACGNYEISRRWRTAKMRSSLTKQALVRLRGVVRRDSDVNERCRQLITEESFGQLIARHDAPPTPLDQMDRLLVEIADCSSFVGHAASIGRLDALACRIYLESIGSIGQLFGTVHALGFIGEPKFANNLAGTTCSLTLKGWERADAHRRTMRTGNQAFVAMWFHPSMTPTYENAIVPAIRACGYTPYLVSRAPTDKKIDDDIIAHIRKSRLVVADLTGIRPNVFYEAGFAHGLGIPLVLTCAREAKVPYAQAAPDGALSQDAEIATWFEHVERHAFDVRQYVILSWSNHEELCAAIETNIRARGLDLPIHEQP